ncbi:MAG: aminoglycoside phosphotransferase family protein [Thermoanaerobaculia bacterium]
MLVTFLRENWTAFFGSVCPAEVEIAVVSSCGDAHGNDLVLIFADSGRSPDYVMKIPRSGRYGFKVEREYAALGHVAQDGLLRPLVPEPHYLGTFEGQAFLIQEGLPGTSLFRLICAKGLNRVTRRLSEEAVDFLVRINSLPTTADSDLELPGDAALALNEVERQRLSERRRELAAAANSYFLHGDYWPRNLLVSGDRTTGIVDWEFAVPAAPLPSDIVWFLVNLGYTLRLASDPGARPEDAFRSAFFEPGSEARFLSECGRRYFAAMGLDPDLFLPLLEVSLCGMAQRELESYGRRGKMDTACLSMLRHTLEHETELCVG